MDDVRSTAEPGIRGMPQVSHSSGRFQGIRNVVTVILWGLAGCAILFGLALALKVARDWPHEAVRVLPWAAAHVVLGALVIVRRENMKSAVLAVIPATACVAAYGWWELVEQCAGGEPNPKALVSIYTLIAVWLIASFVAFFAPGHRSRGQVMLRAAGIAVAMTGTHILLPEPQGDLPVNTPCISQPGVTF